MRYDRVGRRLGIAWAVLAWFALTWLSLVLTFVLIVVTGTIVGAERKRRALVTNDDLDDLI